MLPDESDARAWLRIAVWLVACALSAILGGMINQLACGCGGQVEPSFSWEAAEKWPDWKPPDAAQETAPLDAPVSASGSSGAPRPGPLNPCPPWCPPTPHPAK